MNVDVVRPGSAIETQYAMEAPRRLGLLGYLACFRGIVWREHFSLSKLFRHCLEQILSQQARRLAAPNRSIDRLFLCPLDDRRQNRTADKAAAIQHFLPAAPKPDGQQPVFVGLAEDALDDLLSQRGHRRSMFPAALGHHSPIERQIVGQIYLQDFGRGFAVRACYFDLSIDPPRPQHGRIDQIRTVGSQDNDHVLQ